MVIYPTVEDIPPQALRVGARFAVERGEMPSGDVIVDIYEYRPELAGPGLGFINALIAIGTTVVGGVIGSRAGKREEETARDQLKDQIVLGALRGLQQEIQVGRMTHAAAAAEFDRAVEAYYSQIAQFRHSSVRQSAENYRPAFADWRRVLENTPAPTNAPSASGSAPVGAPADGSFELGGLALPLALLLIVAVLRR